MRSSTSNAAARYLDALAARAPAGTLLDVRYRVDGYGLRRFFVGMHGGRRAAIVTRIGQHTDVYVGVAPRTRRSGGRADVAPTTFVWALSVAAACRPALLPARSLADASASEHEARLRGGRDDD